MEVLGRHPTNLLSSSPAFYDAKDLFGEPFLFNESVNFDSFHHTIIGNDVWIGTDVKIMTGVKIGDGAIVGAGSIVTKDVAPFSVVAGSPAKLIKMRFSDDIIERIQNLEWWSYDLSRYELQRDDLQKTIEQLEILKNDGILKPYVSSLYSVSEVDSEFYLTDLGSE